MFLLEHRSVPEMVLQLVDLMERCWAAQKEIWMALPLELQKDIPLVLQKGFDWEILKDFWKG